MRRRAAGLALALALGGCGERANAPAVVIPSRHLTAGDALLALAPGGADAVLELDLGRLRGNPTVGRLIAALVPDPAAGASGLTGADVLVALSYGLGDGAPRTLVVVGGGGAARVAGATPLGGGAFALGEAELVRRAEAVAAGSEAALTDDRDLLRLRALAMPDGADAAVVRLTARLGFDARIQLARRLGLDAVPVTISLWGDVVDDLAVIALAGAESVKDTRALEQGSGRLVARLARATPVVGAALARELGRTRVEVRGQAVRFTLVVGPRRLAALVARALDALVVVPTTGDS